MLLGATRRLSLWMFLDATRRLAVASTGAYRDEDFPFNMHKVMLESTGDHVDWGLRKVTTISGGACLPPRRSASHEQRRSRTWDVSGRIVAHLAVVAAEASRRRSSLSSTLCSRRRQGILLTNRLALLDVDLDLGRIEPGGTCLSPRRSASHEQRRSHTWDVSGRVVAHLAVVAAEASRRRSSLSSTPCSRRRQGILLTKRRR